MDRSAAAGTDDPRALARAWRQRMGESPQCTVGLEGSEGRLALEAVPALVELIHQALRADESVLVLVPDDEFLPAFSSALDIELRPLCLVLPAADFAARIAMRATLSLLRSRLARASEEERPGHPDPWQRQRERVRRLDVTWAAAEAWNASNARIDWPPATPELFPVRVLSMAAFRTQPRKRAHLAICFCCDPGSDAAFLGDRLMFLGGRSHAAGAGPVTASDEASQLQRELAQLTQDVGDLELELATAQAEMADFTSRYHRLVGRRLTELDVLRAKLAQHELTTLTRDEAPETIQDRTARYEQLREQAQRSRAESKRFDRAQAGWGDEATNRPPPPFRPDGELKKLFRQVAQRIHPDRATNEADREWRTKLMSEANRAYREGNREALEEVRALWEEGATVAVPPTATTPGSAATPAGGSALQESLRRQIAAMRARFDAIRAELHRLFGSKLYELFLAARQLARHGRDMLQDMADKLDTQIQDLLAALRAANIPDTPDDLAPA